MDDSWQDMHGGYKVPYDPRAVIAKLDKTPNSSSAWNELFDNLHHQGDLGEASYASIPLIVDTLQDKPRTWRFYCLIAIIEGERHQKSNPSVPSWLCSSYLESINKAKDLALLDLKSSTDKEMTRCAMAVVAMALGLIALGKVIAHSDEDELEEISKNM